MIRDVLERLMPTWKERVAAVVAFAVPLAGFWWGVLSDLTQERAALAANLKTLPKMSPDEMTGMTNELNALRDRNRRALTESSDAGRGVVLQMLSQIDDLITQSDLMLSRREDPRAPGTDPVRLLPQNMRQSLSSEELLKHQARRSTPKVPGDVAYSEYRHTIQGGYHQIVAFLHRLNGLKGPCQVRNVSLEPVESSTAPGWLTLTFTLGIFHGK